MHWHWRTLASPKPLRLPLLYTWKERFDWQHGSFLSYWKLGCWNHQYIGSMGQVRNILSRLPNLKPLIPKDLPKKLAILLLQFWRKKRILGHASNVWMDHGESQLHNHKSSRTNHNKLWSCKLPWPLKEHIHLQAIFWRPNKTVWRPTASSSYLCGSSILPGVSWIDLSLKRNKWQGAKHLAERHIGVLSKRQNDDKKSRN